MRMVAEASVRGDRRARDVPGATDRSNQQLAALTYLTTRSAVKNEIDPNRTAVMGWSMG
ncbi:hypothetical protein ACFVYV_52410 [Streptomyces mirabilis]|uniref:poly(ethylene terephthalate) hydrolase family protein n=1 Tax=Streptomyces TaxID=1883 RepID=UPI0015CC4228|nr:MULTISPECIES: hypothetical protein [unclassified Streptomyces]